MSYVFTMPEERDYWDIVLPTFMENWSQALRDMSISFVSQQMDRDTMIYLGSTIREQRDLFEKYLQELPPLSESSPTREASLLMLFANLHRKLGVSPFFVRLGSRSPKDCYEYYKKRYRYDQPIEALSAMTDGGSERVAEDLATALRHDYLSHLVFRPWVDIMPGSEARCFVRGGICVGVSEYDYHTKDLSRRALAQPGMTNVYASYPSLARKAAEAAGIYDLVVDVCLFRTHGGWQQTVIEVNPFFKMTDACLFSWDKPEDFSPGAVRFLPIG